MGQWKIFLPGKIKEMVAKGFDLVQCSKGSGDRWTDGQYQNKEHEKTCFLLAPNHP
jgi:hypothetical protein